MKHFNLVTFDIFLIPDPIRRHKLEAMELFRRGSNLNDAIHTLELEVGVTVKNPAEQFAIKVAIDVLKKRVENLMEDGIKRYLGAKNVLLPTNTEEDQINHPASFEYIEPDRKG